jgi:hypothetical protein
MSFLERLKDSLEAFDLRHLYVLNSRQLVRTGSAIRGRPDSASIARSVARGSLQIDCHILDNYRQRIFATLFFLTLEEIQRLLKSWGHLKGQVIKQPRRSQIMVELQSLALPLQLDFVLNATRNAPYPFGTKALARECSRFWRLHGQLGMDTDSSGLGFITMAVDAARAFEIYALEYFARILTTYQHISGANFDYQLRDCDSHEIISRSIKPDHLLFDADREHLVALEVKYSLDLGTRAHISQIMSYLNYKAYPFKSNLRTAFLVYPGSEFRRWSVLNFDSTLDVVTIPVSREALEKARAISLE